MAATCEEKAADERPPGGRRAGPWDTGSGRLTDFATGLESSGQSGLPQSLGLFGIYFSSIPSNLF